MVTGGLYYLWNRVYCHKQHDMYMAKAGTNVRGPKATYIPPAHVRCMGGRVGFAGLFGYQQVGIGNALVLRTPNAKPRHKGFCIAVAFTLFFRSTFG